MLLVLVTTFALGAITPAHAVPLFTLANKNTFCAAPCTGTPIISSNIGIPNGAAPFFNITVTASAADSVTFSSTSNATGPIVSFKDNPLVFSGAGAINETVTIAAPATGFHGGYSVVITGTDSGGTASLTYLVKIYTISIRIDAASTGPTDATATLTGSNGKTFVVSAIVNASTSGGRCAVAFPCSFPLYGWQIGFNYDPTKLIAQGDPCGTVCPTGTVPDGALP